MPAMHESAEDINMSTNRGSEAIGRWLRHLALACMLLAAPGFAPAAHAQAEAAVTERGVKAAFLYKFASYVEWPESAFARPDAPLVFGVLGSEPMAQELTRLAANRSVDGRPLQVRHLKDGDALTGLHVLFVGQAEGARLDQVSRATHAQPTLIVTESTGALGRGSTINFMVAEGRVKFAISTENADKRALKLSSRLLTVAQNMGAAP